MQGAIDFHIYVALMDAAISLFNFFPAALSSSLRFKEYCVLDHRDNKVRNKSPLKRERNGNQTCRRTKCCSRTDSLGLIPRSYAFHLVAFHLVAFCRLIHMPVRTVSGHDFSIRMSSLVSPLHSDTNSKHAMYCRGARRTRQSFTELGWKNQSPEYVWVQQKRSFRG